MLKTDRQEKPDFERIAQALGGTKTVAQVAQYHYDWKKRHPPMQQYLQSFLSEQIEPPAINTAAGATNAEFLVANAAKDGVVSLPSGLQYKVVSSGPADGARPSANSQCSCHFIGTTIDGTVFDSSRKRGSPSSFKPSQVVQGWTEAVQLMRPGDRWMLYLPAALGYGALGHEAGHGGKIPGGATLIFDLELICLTEVTGPALETSLLVAPDSPIAGESSHPSLQDEHQSGLTAAEHSGLRDASRRTRIWTLSELTAMYKSAKAHGVTEFALICDSMSTDKSTDQVRAFMKNWKSRTHDTFISYVQSFDATVTTDFDRNADVGQDGVDDDESEHVTVPLAPGTDVSPGSAGLSAAALPMAGLSASEKRGVLDLASRSRSAGRDAVVWSPQELATYYVTLQRVGPDLDQITLALSGSKTRQDVVSYHTNWWKQEGVHGRTLSEYFSLPCFADMNDPARPDTTPPSPAGGALQKEDSASGAPGVIYTTVDPEETPIQIAKALGCSADDLIDQNSAKYAGLRDTSKLKVGTTLTYGQDGYSIAVIHSQERATKTGPSAWEGLGCGDLDRRSALQAASAQETAGQVAPAPMPAAGELTEHERLGLLSISSRAKTWSHSQITSYYKALVHHGHKFQAISESVAGKSAKECRSYFDNWSARYPPMQQWLTEFNSAELEGAAPNGTMPGRRVKEADDDDVTITDKCSGSSHAFAVTESHPISETSSTATATPLSAKQKIEQLTEELTMCERLALEHLAARPLSAWTFDELMVYYVTLSEHGVGCKEHVRGVYDKIAQALDGVNLSKTRKQISNFMSDWTASAKRKGDGPAFEDYVQSFTNPSKAAQVQPVDTGLSESEKRGIRHITKQPKSTWSYADVVAYYSVIKKHGPTPDHDRIAEALATQNSSKSRKQIIQFHSNWSLKVQRGGKSLKAYLQSYADENPVDSQAIPQTLQSAHGELPADAPSVAPTADELTESEKLGLLDLAARKFWSYEELTVYYAIVKARGSAAGNYDVIAEALKGVKSDKSRKKVREFTNNFAMRPSVRGRTMQAYLQSFAAENVVELSSSEQLGLHHLASRSKVWTYEQLAVYISVLKREGPDFERITEELGGSKTLLQVTSYWSNWKQKGTGLSIQEFLAGFGSTRQPHAVPAAVAAQETAQLRSARGRGPADLTESELRGLRDLASRRQTNWSFDELKILYLTVEAHGSSAAGLDVVHRALGGSKTRMQVTDYYYKFATKVGVNGRSMRDYLQSFAPTGETSEQTSSATENPANELSSSELLGLSNLASRKLSIWSFDELKVYYLALQAHGRNIDKITEALGGTKTKDQVMRYTANFRTK